MKGLNVLVAFLGGAAVGAAVGILFAPEKGEDTPHKIEEILRKKGIRKTKPTKKQSHYDVRRRQKY